MNTDSAVTDSKLDPQERKRILRILESNWQAEMRGQKPMQLWRKGKQTRNGARLFVPSRTPNNTTQIFGLAATVL
jgi:hypothetical protein